MKETVVTIAPDQKVALAAQMMLWGGLRHLPVVMHDALVGIVSARDILLAQRPMNVALRVQDVMKSPVHTARADDSVEEAASRMVAEGVGCLPIMDGDRLTGIVTSTDLLAFLAHPTEMADGRARPEARDVMSTLTLSCSPSEDVLDVVTTMVREGVRHLPVVDGDERVIGIVSDRDIRAAIGDPLRALRERDTGNDEPWPIESVMTADPITARADTPLEELARCFVDESVGAVPVVDSDSRLVGVVSYVDLLRFWCRLERRSL